MPHRLHSVSDVFYDKILHNGDIKFWSFLKLRVRGCQIIIVSLNGSFKKDQLCQNLKPTQRGKIYRDQYRAQGLKRQTCTSWLCIWVKVVSHLHYQLFCSSFTIPSLMWCIVNSLLLFYFDKVFLRFPSVYMYLLHHQEILSKCHEISP